jgi:Arc/MetJ-type ribon-helix-helix transcriptional regulator
MLNITKAVTVRLPESLYEAGREVAKRRRMSLNQFVQHSLRAALEQEERERLYEAFSRLGGDADEMDVEFALDAQREVVTRGDA